MAQIIRGTTPTITFSYSDIQVSDISKAVLVLKQGGKDVLEKDKTTATADTANNTLSWTLSQAETLDLSSKDVTLVCDWVLANGVRGRSHELISHVGEPGKNEVI